ncbi:hypothetical protein Mesau_06013 [Mesorhizobium australicum WSM2073]|uniref:TniQ domain-containing protein n=1 Tax=Mesorhizobium australicum (strain HAMBI 3006 / LMG 24608 / WSM2073) TaxID=754035 RepID=L0KS14_MESAW|nr:TniQ family protein [Mesorhizobium australicum]AGB48232.1 hypothetical protein Mesau_06013 [Mesorhizobium australicum WSM2073]
MLDRVDSERLVPVISRWGIQPLADEPAHGFFLRLAALNGQVSIRPFAMALGINGRNIKPQEMLSFCAELPIPGLDILRDATPVLGDRGSVYIRGERLRVGRDWSTRHRRYCAKCLEESSHHRFWFDILAISHCPFHGQEMSVEKNGMVWAQGYSANAMRTPATSNLAKIGLAQYLAGRLGVLPRVRVALLDAMELTDAIFLSAVIGDMIQVGWRSRKPDADRTQSTQQAADRGLCFLLDGRSLIDLCSEYIRAGRFFIDGKLTSRKPTHVLGWLESPMRNQIHHKGIAPLRDCIRALLGELRPPARRKRVQINAEFDRGVDVIAKSLRLRSSAVRQLAVACGQLTCRDLNADAIANMATRACSPETAAELLGVSDKRLATLRDSQLIQPLIKGCAGNPAKYDVEAIHSLIDQLSARYPTAGVPTAGLTLEQYQRKMLCSYPTVARQVLTGQLPISGLDLTKNGFSAILVPQPSVHRIRRTALDDGYVTAEQAAARLCVQPNVIKNLVKLRIIHGLEKGGKAWAVDVQSLERFASDFVPAKVLAERLQCPVCKLPARLQSLGISIAFSTRQIGVTIVRRSDVARVVPVSSDSSDLADQFFRAMRAYFLTSRYGHGLRWVEGESNAIILGIGGRVRLSVEYQAKQSATDATLVISSSASERKFALADDKFRALWPESTMGIRSGGRATVSQSCALDGQTSSHEPTFNWLESCALSLRSLVGQPCKWGSKPVQSIAD